MKISIFRYFLKSSIYISPKLNWIVLRRLFVCTIVYLFMRVIFLYTLLHNFTSSNCLSDHSCESIADDSCFSTKVCRNVTFTPSNHVKTWNFLYISEWFLNHKIFIEFLIEFLRSIRWWWHNMLKFKIIYSMDKCKIEKCMQEKSAIQTITNL